MFLILLAMRPVAAVYRWCQRWMPSNILVRRVRTRAGLRFGIPLALLGGVYLIAGVGCLKLAMSGPLNGRAPESSWNAMTPNA